MWTQEELEEIFPCAEKRYFDVLFAKRKKVTLTNIVNARSIHKDTRQYGIWALNYDLWEKADGRKIEQIRNQSIANWRKFAKAIKALDTEKSQ